MKLSPHFSLDEFEYSYEAIRRGIDNSVPDYLVPKVEYLCRTVLEPVRERFGRTKINSGYRGLGLNSMIGGSTNSQHTKGEAADIVCEDGDNYEVACFIRDSLEFDQLILECYKPGQPRSGWVHVSAVMAPKVPRKSVLTYDGKSYQQGLIK